MTPRDEQVQRLRSRKFDVLIVGGGVNGAVAAAALSSAGASVALVEKNDFASGTSQESSCLVWGGIKYLENYEFGLVRELCLSRNRLLRELPDHVSETRFFAPHAPGFRSGLGLLSLGTWLYWWFGNRATKPPARFGAKALSAQAPLLKEGLFDGAVEYSDGVMAEHDARFTLHFIRMARSHGAATVNRAELLGATQGADGSWIARVRNAVDGDSIGVPCRVLINAAGPWADPLNEINRIDTKHRLLYSKGVHLVVRDLGLGDKVLALFADDGRLFFAIPFGGRTLLGTTDTRVDRLPTRVEEDDRSFILRNINKRLALPVPLTEADIISERCGVRPLVVPRSAPSGGDWMKLSRKHVVESDSKRLHVTIFGGKLTDCLNLGEDVVRAVRHLGVFLPLAGNSWHSAARPGERGRFFARASESGFPTRLDEAERRRAHSRLWMRWEREAERVLDLAQANPEYGEEIFPGSEFLLGEAYLSAADDQCIGIEDFLRRRTRLALRFRKEELATRRGLVEALRIVFPKDWERKWKDHFGTTPP